MAPSVSRRKPFLLAALWVAALLAAFLVVWLITGVWFDERGEEQYFNGIRFETMPETALRVGYASFAAALFLVLTVPAAVAFWKITSGWRWLFFSVGIVSLAAAAFSASMAAFQIESTSSLECSVFADGKYVETACPTVTPNPVPPWER